MSQVKVVAVSVVHKTVTPGKAGNRLTGEAPVKPVIQEIQPGVSFVMDEGKELDRLIAIGAVRLPETRETFTKGQSDLTDLLAAEAGRDPDEIYKAEQELAAKKAAAEAEAKAKAGATGKPPARSATVGGEPVAGVTETTDTGTDRAAAAAARRKEKAAKEKSAKEVAATSSEDSVV